MVSIYDRFIEKENAFYQTLLAKPFEDFELLPSSLNDGLNWLIGGSDSVVDFGCGSGTLSVLCALRGVQQVLGIDLAGEGIQKARIYAQNLPQCQFLQGSIQEFQALPDDSYDGVIFSNILDNLMPGDALAALDACVRILKPGGKLLLKLNPHLSEAQIRKWGIAVLEGDLLDDGMLLWNKEDSFWLEKLHSGFREVTQVDVFYQEHSQHNRMFLCVK